MTTPRGDVTVEARQTSTVNDYLAPYGAAWEHEFNGRQRATTYGHDIATPTLYGGTGIGELGLTLKPSKTLPLSFDLDGTQACNNQNCRL